MFDYKSEAARLIADQNQQLNIEEILNLIEIPPNPELGDFAVPCFVFAKVFRKSPDKIAEEIAGRISENKLFERIINTGPYINFFADRKNMAMMVLNQIFMQGNEYGSLNLGKNKNVIVEFSSPNIAKPFHIGHIRTTVIGNSLYKIYKFMKYNAVAVNHLGDYGTQFGMLIAAYKKWGNHEEIEGDPINELLKLYVKFNDEAEKSPELRDEARYWFKELENKNEEAEKLWRWIKDVSLREFEKVYKLLNIHFDSYAGESFYSDKMQEIIEILEEKRLLEESEGACIVNLEKYGMTSPLIKKSDGSTLYLTRDIAAAKYRKDAYDFYKNIYVVGSQQILHFQQLVKVIELMGCQWANDCVHVPFGMVSLEDGTLSTRKGRVVFLEDVLKKAVEKTKEIIDERNPDLENKEEVARQVGIGAVIFQELYNNRIKDYTFSWEKVLSFEGETGPYVQYTYARTASILRKGENPDLSDVDFNELAGEIEFQIVKTLMKFSEIIESSINKNEPFYITRYIVDIAQKFNKYYNSCQILVDDDIIRKSRLLLTYAVNTVLKTGLALLGIEAPDKM